MDESLKSTKRFRARARVWLILVGCSFWLLLSCGGGEEAPESLGGTSSLDADLLFEEPRAPPRTQPPPEDAVETGGPGGVSLALDQGEDDPCAPLIEAAVSEVPSFFLDEDGFSIQGPGSLLPALPSAHFCPFGAHSDKVNAVRFSPDGFYAASAGADRSVSRSGNWTTKIPYTSWGRFARSLLRWLFRWMGRFWPSDKKMVASPLSRQKAAPS